ncbi:unnamed protein product [Brassicogethes aeneus]|uniref:Adenosine 5'-monophosphoramidase HINT3 n=1 Tax=Brassicogethes aeneus TaxID=1431903 RepID=A0A9P0F900_BRAAE|nr:unnamed protein product [Brassicogethes aeneus]
MSTNCIFCKIISDEVTSTKYFENDELLVFKDIKPASKVHVLAIPKKHIVNVNSLTKSDIPLINQLLENGKRIVEELGGDTEDMLMGFHKPPFNSISHLHLHLISPCKDMSLISRLMFCGWWFTSVDNVLTAIKSKL